MYLHTIWMLKLRRKLVSEVCTSENTASVCAVTDFFATDANCISFR